MSIFVLFAYCIFIFNVSAKCLLPIDPIDPFPYTSPSPFPIVKTYTPLYIGTSAGDPIILAPGKGWMAYVDWGSDLNLSYSALKQKLDTLISGGCDHLYIRNTWKEFADTAPNHYGSKIRNFLNEINQSV